MSLSARGYLLGIFFTTLGLGVVLLLKRIGLTSTDVRIMWPFIILILVLVAGLFKFPGVRQASGEIEFQLKGIERAHIRLVYQVRGRLIVEGGGAPDQLLGGWYETEIEHTERIVDEIANLELRVSLDRSPRWSYPEDCQFTLNDDLPLTLDIETAARDTRINLLPTQVTSLHLNSIASPLDVTLPAGAGYTVVTLEGGNATAVLHVPGGVAARITGFNSPDFVDVDPRRFPRVDGCWESPDYKTAANRVDIAIKFGAGTVKIR